jgi:hypothetical protein
MLPAVAAAIDEVRRTFPEAAVEATPDGSGGAFVVVRDIVLTSRYAQRGTWLGFHITYLHPAADVYPHYVRPDLARADGQPLGVGFAQTTWVHGGQQVMQLSRKSNRWDPRRDTPALKALKVLAWLAEPS